VVLTMARINACLFLLGDVANPMSMVKLCLHRSTLQTLQQ
jgi:hypothetical protein